MGEGEGEKGDSFGLQNALNFLCEKRFSYHPTLGPTVCVCGKHENFEKGQSKKKIGQGKVFFCFSPFFLLHKRHMNVFPLHFM